MSRQNCCSLFKSLSLALLFANFVISSTNCSFIRFAKNCKNVKGVALNKYSY